MATTRATNTTTAATTADTALTPDVRRALKRTALALRHALEDDFGRQLRAAGIDEQAIHTVPAGRALTDEQQRVRDAAVAVIQHEIGAGATHPQAFDYFRRESVFTFLNRAIGLRCLEARRMLLVDGQTETAITRLDDLGGVPSLYWRVKNAPEAPTQPRELWRETIRRACAAVSRDIRVLFDPDSEYAALFPLLPAMQQVADALNDPTIPEAVYAEDAVLGWVYQYFQSEEKDRIFAEVRTKKKKIGGGDIIPVTQLYTEQYMVDFLLQNSLGRTWMEMYPDSAAKSAWPYYVEPATPHTRPRKPLKEWTILDPCVGSGHFLVVAFDLLAQLYAEERALAAAGAIPAEWAVPEAEVPATILARNLYGIDIDRRACQLATLALYLKARQAGLPRNRAGGLRINVVAADACYFQGESWRRFLAGFEREPSVRRVLEAMAGYLKDIRELGSLLRPEEELKRLIAEEHRAWEDAGRPQQAGLFAEYELPRQERLDFEQISDETFWEHLAYRAEAAIQAFYDQAHVSGDLDEQIVAGEAQRGFAFLELCQRRYDVVCTNPPYMGSGNMTKSVKDFLAKQYTAGKYDLYSAFIMRCDEYARLDGYVAMVTQQSWMFLSTYANFRSIPAPKPGSMSQPFSGILRQASFEALAHLGRYAFSEIGNALVAPVLFTLRSVGVTPEHRMWACRLLAPRPADEQAALLRSAAHVGTLSTLVTISFQSRFLSVPDTPVVYWLRDSFLRLFSERQSFGTVAEIRHGLSTCDNDRFVRGLWELGSERSGWAIFAKGGTYRKWCGLEHWLVDWRQDGRAIKDSIRQKFPYLKGNVGLVIGSEEFYFREGWTYSTVCSGNFGVRTLSGRSISSHASYGIFPQKFGAESILLNSRLSSYLLRSLTPKLSFEGGQVAALPLVSRGGTLPQFPLSSDVCIALKVRLIQADPTEYMFARTGAEIQGKGGSASAQDDVEGTVPAVLHALEGWSEKLVFDALSLNSQDVTAITNDTGTPSGWHPLIASYDALPALPEGLPPVPAELTEYLAQHERLALAPAELARVKERLRALYIAGPGAKVEDDAAEELAKGGKNGNGDGAEDGDDDEAAVALGARIPIPAETFLEELSQRLEIHPISVYWLLEEMRRDEGLVCPPEMKRQMEDYASVSLLRILGFRWPEQDAYEAEHGPILDPALVVPDGILPLVDCGPGTTTAAARIRARLECDFGEEGAARSEDDFRRWVGRSLEDWLRRDFFKRHISQFKQRPIAWHVKSKEGTFEAFVLYHKLCDGEAGRATLQRLRTQYAGGLVERLRGEQARAKANGDAGEVTKLQLAIEDVEELRARLEQIERGDTLAARIRCRWKGDEAKEGRPGPYMPDINDGVKVNVRPLQDLGLLAATVIKKWE